jgi:hypothetical protein
MGLATVHAFAGHSQYHLIEGMFWACFGIFYFASGMAVWWELRAEGLLRRNFWDTELIPYTDITSIEQLTDMARPVEVQYFSTSPDTFPRKKMIIVISDRQNFIDALIKLAPSAEFRS